MIRITREADYGILLMTGLAQAEGQPRSAAALAQQRRLPLPMVSKILKALARAGLLTSQRGVQGGYSLARTGRDQGRTTAKMTMIAAATPGLSDLTTISPRTYSASWARRGWATSMARNKSRAWEVLVMAILWSKGCWAGPAD